MAEHRARKRTFAAVLVVATGGCSGTEAGESDRVVVRDSGADPIPEVGGDVGAATLFNVVFAGQTSQGQVVLVDGGSRTIHWQEADGSSVQSSGGAGEGPGEFRGIQWADLTTRDSLYAWDGQARRMSVFGDEGFVRAFALQVPAPWGAVSVGGVLDDGGAVVMATPLPGPAEGEGISRPGVPVWIMSPDGEVRAEVGTFPGAAVDLRAGAAPGTVIRRVIPFGPRTVVGAAGSWIAIGDSERYEIALHDAEGALRRIVRVPGEAPPVSAADLEAELERRLEAAPPIEEVRDGIRATFEDTPAPAFKPYFDTLLVEPDGTVWARRVGSAGSGEGASWDVMTSTGRWLGTLRTPAGLEVKQVTAGALVGVWRDELGVESVRAFALDRGVAGGGERERETTSREAK
jgi:hypothetical protein